MCSGVSYTLFVVTKLRVATVLTTEIQAHKNGTYITQYGYTSLLYINRTP